MGEDSFDADKLPGNHISFEEHRLLKEVSEENGDWVANPFLSMIMRRLRSKITVDDEKLQEEKAGYFLIPSMYNGRKYDLPLIYFSSKGCRFDKAGACTMCNFGRGANFSDDELFDAVKPLVEKFKGEPPILVTPNGSMFDDREVGPQLRKRILQLIADNGFKAFYSESRAEFLTEDTVAEMRQILGNDMEIEIGIGLETSDPLVGKYSINKMFSREKYLEAVKVLKKFRIDIFAHALLKGAFLSEREAYEDALSTIKWAFENGADRVGIGLMNLKKGTLTNWLAEHGRYEPPNYWTVIQLLKALPEDIRQKVTLFGLDSGIIIQKEAGNCPVCSPDIRKLLQRYFQTYDNGILEEAWNYNCACKKEWEAKMNKNEPPLKARLKDEYEFIAKGLMGEKWLQNNEAVLKRSLPG